MGANAQAMLPAASKDLLRFFGGERALVAEDVHELGELPLRRPGNHLLTDELNILL